MVNLDGEAKVSISLTNALKYPSPDDFFQYDYIEKFSVNEGEKDDEAIGWFLVKYTGFKKPWYF